MVFLAGNRSLRKASCCNWLVVKGADAAAAASVRPGQTITYRIAYTNTGTEVALYLVATGVYVP